MNSNLNYDEFNRKINNITSNLCDLLDCKRIQSFGSAQIWKYKWWIYSVPYITWQRAVKVNLGSIEKNMFITPEVCPGVDWGTVLTNAPLDVICPDL